MFSLGFKSARLFGRNLTVWDFFLKVTYDFNQSQASSPMTSTNHRQGHIWLQPITGKSSRMSSTNHGQAHKWLQPITVSQSSSQMTDQSQVRSHMTSTNHRQGTAISLHMYSSTGTRIDRGNYYLLPVPYVFHENFHFSCKQSCGTESLLTGSDVSIVYNSFWNVKILTDVKKTGLKCC